MVLDTCYITCHKTCHYLQDPWRHPFGGTDRSRRIALEAQICQIISAIHFTSRPRTRTLLPILNAMFSSLKHVNTKFAEFFQHIGLAVRWGT